MTRHMIGCAFAAALWALPLQAQEAEIRGVIADQIAAFQADDFARAFSFASPTIKGVFGDAQNFGRMVQQGYPMVHRPANVRMMDLRDEAGRLWQRVLVTDQAGRSHVLEYQMIETPEGWQINAVQLLKSAGVGA